MRDWIAGNGKPILNSPLLDIPFPKGEATSRTRFRQGNGRHHHPHPRHPGGPPAGLAGRDAGPHAAATYRPGAPERARLSGRAGNGGPPCAGALQHRRGGQRPSARGDSRNCEEPGVRPDHHGLARAPRHDGVPAGQRDATRAGQDPPARAGVPLGPTAGPGRAPPRQPAAASACWKVKLSAYMWSRLAPRPASRCLACWIKAGAPQR
ncbi:hypothetical protein G6F57_019499 [Rhizopus arrhizus]|nr:hypothetical protein G6F57_019499 [Rhizopus arrhizus]